MYKLILCLLAVLFVFALGTPYDDALAQGNCQNTKSGKCPVKKKVTHKRSEFTAKQREAMMEEARKICKKKYGSASTVYKLDYYKWMVICNEH